MQVNSDSNGIDLVLGADGFLGRNLAARLPTFGRKVLAIGREAGDLSLWDNVAAAFRGLPPFARIFHVVTRQRTGAIQYKMQGELLAINARIHLNVLEAWRQFQPQAKLVSTGSSCAYPESNEPQPETVFQTGPLHPSVTGYGLAKQMLAVGAQVYAEQYGLRHLHCILATMYGPWMHVQPDRSHFIGGMLQRAREEKRAGKDRFTVWGDPSTVRELLYVDDQIDAILAVDDAFENAMVNCAANIPVTIGEVAAAILDALEWRVPIYTPPESCQGTSYKMLDSSCFLEKTGWRPKVTLRDGLAKVLAADKTL